LAFMSRGCDLDGLLEARRRFHGSIVSRETLSVSGYALR
jgi:hypothetical protein